MYMCTMFVLYSLYGIDATSLASVSKFIPTVHAYKHVTYRSLILTYIIMQCSSICNAKLCMCRCVLDYLSISHISHYFYRQCLSI